MNVKQVMFLIILLMGTWGFVQAQVTVYNNFGIEHNGWDYDYQTGWTVAGINDPVQYGVEQAMGFTSTHGGAVGPIWVAAWEVPSSPAPDTIYVRLAINANGLYPRPEDVLQEWVISDLEDWSQWNPPIQLAGDGSAVLEENQEYWLWMAASDETRAGWCMNIDPNVLCPHTLRREGEDWLSVSEETASAFRVDVCMSINNLLLTSNPGEAFATLSWDAPLEGIPTSYEVYLDGDLVATTQDLEWVFTTLQCGSVYEAGVVAVYDGAVSVMQSVQFLYIGTEAQPGIAAMANLLGNYPNPFNPTTEISFALAQPDHVIISIYNARGQKIRQLLDANKTAATHSIVWDGKDDMGILQPSGLYMCQMQTRNSGVVKRCKMVLMK